MPPNPTAATPLTPQQWHDFRTRCFQAFRTTATSLVNDRPAKRIQSVESDAELFNWPNADLYNHLIEQATTDLDRQTIRQYGLQPLTTEDLMSVVVPVFNEGDTIIGVLERLASCPAVSQIIVVDDASTDRTGENLRQLQCDEPFWTRRLPGGLSIVSHTVNQGKGAALRTGFPLAKQPWIAIQDADNEYNPMDLMRLLSAANESQSTVVYGSRFLLCVNDSSPLWHRFGNQTITKISNVFNGLRLTDVETCYKLIKTSLIQSIGPSLKENRFGIEIELTAKLARSASAKFCEQPISYNKRTYAQGKKIGIKDGIRAIWCMVRYHLSE